MTSEKTYTVAWLIELDADSPREAAEVAQRIQRDWGNEAYTFNVKEWDGKKCDVDEWEEIDLGVK